MMRERNKLEASLQSYDLLSRDFEDAVALVELAVEEADASMTAEAEQGLRDLTARAKQA